MIGYVTVGTNDLPKAIAFYDALFGEMGAGRFMEEDTFVAWAITADQPGVAVTKPFNGEAATPGNGTMIGLQADSKEMVHQIYDKALALGGTCEGPAGPRGPGFYAGYFRDLDGNKFNVFYMDGEQ